MNELKPCPFCGGKDVILSRGQIVGTRDNGMRSVWCRDCDVRSAYVQKEEAISRWNTRAKEDV